MTHVTHHESCGCAEARIKELERAHEATLLRYEEFEGHFIIDKEGKLRRRIDELKAELALSAERVENLIDRASKAEYESVLSAMECTKALLENVRLREALEKLTKFCPEAEKHGAGAECQIYGCREGRLALASSRQAFAKEDHACSTGDCSHEKQTECDAALASEFPAQSAQETPKPDYYYQGVGTTYKAGKDPEVTCKHCNRTFLCDPMDAACRLCGEWFSDERIKKYGSNKKQANEEGEK